MLQRIRPSFVIDEIWLDLMQTIPKVRGVQRMRNQVNRTSRYIGGWTERKTVR